MPPSVFDTMSIEEMRGFQLALKQIHMLMLSCGLSAVPDAVFKLEAGCNAAIDAEIEKLRQQQEWAKMRSLEEFGA